MTNHGNIVVRLKAYRSQIDGERAMVADPILGRDFSPYEKGQVEAHLQAAYDSISAAASVLDKAMGNRPVKAQEDGS